MHCGKTFTPPLSVDIICQIWPIRGYTWRWYTGTGRLKKWLQAQPPLLSPVSSRFTFVFALSQFSGPNYLGAWNRLLPQELQTRFDLSSARNILLVIQHFHTYSFSRITSKEPVCFFLKQVLGSNMVPLRTKFDTKTTVISQRRTKRVSSSAGLLFGLFGVSSAIVDITRVLAIRASCFYISAKI